MDYRYSVDRYSGIDVENYSCSLLYSRQMEQHPTIRSGELYLKSERFGLWVISFSKVYVPFLITVNISPYMQYR